MIKIIVGTSSSDLETKLNAEMPANILSFSGLTVILDKQVFTPVESEVFVNKVFANGDIVVVETVLNPDGSEKSKVETAKDSEGEIKNIEDAGTDIDE